MKRHVPLRSDMSNVGTVGCADDTKELEKNLKIGKNLD